MRRLLTSLAFLFALAGSVYAVTGRTRRAAAGTEASTEAKTGTVKVAEPDKVVEPIFEGGLIGKWQDWGWAPRDLDTGKPARLQLNNYGGWVLGRRELTGTFSGVTLRVRAPASFGNFLEVRVAAEDDDTFPRIAVVAGHRITLEDNWIEIRVPMGQLNPDNRPFDRVIIRAARVVSAAAVEIDKVALLGTAGQGPAGAGANGAFAGYGGDMPARDVSVRIDCSAQPRPINPMIYGIAFNPRKNYVSNQHKDLGATARRWGGNPSSRYNWQLGNAWNSGADWYFMNVDYTNRTDFTWRTFLEENREAGQATALTVPLIGWVAKDTSSFGFPVSAYGPQRATASNNQDAGNGVTPEGKLLRPLSPSRTSVEAPPEFVGNWVKAIRRLDREQQSRSVSLYYLDNEPMLWNTTHRDVHPDPVSYDELLERSIAYGGAVRDADPDALIAGPSEWGWNAYFYSAKDAQAGFRTKPDRKAHNDVPLLAWYLRQLKAHEKRTGKRIIDVLDVHFYPQGDGIYGDKERTDTETAARRLRSTRGLWDPAYKDESWIDDTVQLIPRLQNLVAENYPGLGISIGEYNFGAEQHMSGGLALADVLGRFGQGGLTAAFYWTYPAANSPAYYAFRAYRNYDSRGSRFLDYSLPTTGDRQTSLFASTDNDRKHIVAVALNLDPHEAADASILLSGCGAVTSGRAFTYTEGSSGLVAHTQAPTADTYGFVKQRLLPYSMTVFELTVTPPTTGAVTPAAVEDPTRRAEVSTGHREAAASPPRRGRQRQ